MFCVVVVFFGISLFWLCLGFCLVVGLCFFVCLVVAWRFLFHFLHGLCWLWLWVYVGVCLFTSGWSVVVFLD